MQTYAFRPHLWRHVGEGKGFVANLLAQPMVPSGGQVSPIESTALKNSSKTAGSDQERLQGRLQITVAHFVVNILGPEVGMDGSVLEKFGPAAVPVAARHRVPRQVLKHPVGGLVPPVVGQDVVPAIRVQLSTNRLFHPDGSIESISEITFETGPCRGSGSRTA